MAQSIHHRNGMSLHRRRPPCRVAREYRRRPLVSRRGWPTRDTDAYRTRGTSSYHGDRNHDGRASTGTVTLLCRVCSRGDRTRAQGKASATTEQIASRPALSPLAAASSGPVPGLSRIAIGLAGPRSFRLPSVTGAGTYTIDTISSMGGLPWISCRAGPVCEKESECER